jgi:uncharacterized protein DUF1573
MTRQLPSIRGKFGRRVLFVVLAVPACYFAYQLGVALGPVGARSRTETRASSSQPDRVHGLEIAPSDLDVGEVWEDPNFVRPVTVTNRGERIVEIVDLRGGCECTAVEPSSFTLAPGESQQVKVKIDLTHRYPHQFGVERRELSVGLYPVLKDRGATAEAWKVTGVIKSRVSLGGRGLAFADMCGQGGPPVTRKMRATAHVPLAGLEASCPASMATVGVRPVAGQPGRYDVLVTPNPSLPLGPFKFDVAVTAVEPNGRKFPCASFTAEGEMGSPVRVVPNPVLLGEHPVGLKAEAFVSVRLPAAGWSVERVETESSETAVTFAGPVEGRPAYRVTQPVTKAGDQNCQVRFVIRKPTGQLETVPAAVRWYGEGAP